MSYYRDFNLLHLFTRAQIQLPLEKSLLALQGYDDVRKEEVHHCITKAILFVSPSVTSDYVLVINYDTNANHLAFWLPRYLNWTKFEIEDGAGGIYNMIYFKGQFYCVTYAVKSVFLVLHGLVLLNQL